jgi:hypothetical protein
MKFGVLEQYKAFICVHEEINGVQLDIRVHVGMIIMVIHYEVPYSWKPAVLKMLWAKTGN